MGPMSLVHPGSVDFFPKAIDHRLVVFLLFLQILRMLLLAIPGVKTADALALGEEGGKLGRGHTRLADSSKDAFAPSALSPSPPG